MAATTVLNPAIVQGTVVSSALPWPVGMTTGIATALVSNQDMKNATLKLNSFAMQVSFDGGKTFQQAVSTPWTFNTLDKNGVATPPSLSVSYDATHLPTHARIEIDSPQALSIGASQDFSA